MVTGEPAEGGAIGAGERRLPPITQIAVATMFFVVIGGIYIAAYLPHHAPLGPPIGLRAAAGSLLLTNVIALSRIRQFAWDKFFLVGGWSLLAYVVIAGMLEYVFVLDHTPSSVLALLTMMLVVFAVNIPLCSPSPSRGTSRWPAADSSRRVEGVESRTDGRPSLLTVQMHKAGLTHARNAPRAEYVRATFANAGSSRRAKHSGAACRRGGRFRWR